MKKVIIGLGLLMIIFPTNAKNKTVELSLEQSIELALANNKNLKISRHKAEIAKAELNQSLAAFLPSVELSVNALKTNDPLNSFGIKLKQEMVTAADFNPLLLNDPGEISNYTSKLDVKLPLLNMDGYYSHRAARSNAEAKSLMAERGEHHLIFEVKKSYYQLEVSDAFIRVLESSLKSAESAVKLSQDLEKQGLIKEADVLMAQVQQANIQAKLLEARNAKRRVQEVFADLIGLDKNTGIYPSDKIRFQEYTLNNEREDIQKRSDIQAYQNGIEARKQLLSAQRMKFVPRINAYASTEWNSQELLGTDAHNYTFGAVLNWKLFNGMKNVGGLKKANIQLKATKLEYADYVEKSRLELNTAKRSIGLIAEQIELSALSQKQAVESYRIINNRYKQGLEKTSDLLNAETLASNSKLAHLKNLYNYQVARSYLEFLLEKNF